MESYRLLIILGLAVLIFIFLAVRRRDKRVDRFEDFNPDGQGPPTGDGAEREAGESKPFEAKQKARKKKLKRSDRSEGDCEHHWEITGFPADRIGTHVNLSCRKCGSRVTVTVEESKTMLRERDDVRQAIRRARGNH